MAIFQFYKLQHCVPCKQLPRYWSYCRVHYKCNVTSGQSYRLRDIATSIADLLTLRYHGAQRSDDIVHECKSLCATEFTATVKRTHIGQYTNQKASIQQTMQRTVIRRPVGDRALSSHPTHTNNITTQASIPRQMPCHLSCTLPTQHPPCLSWW